MEEYELAHGRLIVWLRGYFHGKEGSSEPDETMYDMATEILNIVLDRSREIVKKENKKGVL